MMNLTCAILHADRQVSEQLEAFIAKTPFLALCGKYSNPIEALKGYYDNKVHLYFVGVCTYFTFSHEKSKDEMHFDKCDVEPEEILPLI